MLSNRSLPSAIVVPVLGYPDVEDAVAWLCNTFGFRERLRIGDHRAQLNVGVDGAVVVSQAIVTSGSAANTTLSVMVRVDDADSHYARAKQVGANIVQPLTDFPYGERQYTVVDPGGHVWTFTQSIADVAPETWGGQLLENA